MNSSILVSNRFDVRPLDTKEWEEEEDKDEDELKSSLFELPLLLLFLVCNLSLSNFTRVEFAFSSNRYISDNVFCKDGLS